MVFNAGAPSGHGGVAAVGRAAILLTSISRIHLSTDGDERGLHLLLL